MRELMTRFRYKLRRILPFIFFLLNKVGIKISPFLTAREKGAPPDFDPTASPYGLGFLDATDIDEILEVESGSKRDEIVGWFEEGKLCFGVRDGSRLIAKMWCDLEALHFLPAYRLLEDDEVYLYAACVNNHYRGQNIAPLMRSACCSALSDMGRTRYCSYTDYFNYPARRFKEKLGAKNQALFIHIDLFGKWSRTWTLRHYDQSK
jgi:hypothetical protein